MRPRILSYQDTSRGQGRSVGVQPQGFGINRAQSGCSICSEVRQEAAYLAAKLGSSAPCMLAGSQVSVTLLKRQAYSPPWNRPNARASISDMSRMPAPRTSTCWVFRRLKLPTRQTSR